MDQVGGTSGLGTGSEASGVVGAGFFNQVCSTQGKGQQLLNSEAIGKLLESMVRSLVAQETQVLQREIVALENELKFLRQALVPLMVPAKVVTPVTKEQFLKAAELQSERQRPDPALRCQGIVSGQLQNQQNRVHSAPQGINQVK